MKTLQLFCLVLLLHLSASLRAMAPAHSFTFVAPCQPFATSSPVPNQPGCFSFSATNGGASDPNGYYSWDFGDGTTAVGPTAVHCYTPNLIINHYTVTVTYNSTLVCGPAPMQQSHEVHVIPNAPTGVERQGLDPVQLKLFPNPAAGHLTVEAAQPIRQILICDPAGAELWRGEQPGGLQVVLPVFEYPQGVYLLKIIYFDGSQSNAKFIKK